MMDVVDICADKEGEPIQNAIGLGGPFPSAYTKNRPDAHFGAKGVHEIYENGWTHGWKVHTDHPI